MPRRNLGGVQFLHSPWIVTERLQSEVLHRHGITGRDSRIYSRRASSYGRVMQIAKKKITPRGGGVTSPGVATRCPPILEQKSSRTT